jgi:outer membrane lipoprotein-sorting protein
MTWTLELARRLAPNTHGKVTRCARLTLIPLTAALLAGCPDTRPIARSYPAPAAETLFQAVRARQEKVQSANLETRATSWLDGKRIRATVLMLVDRPGRLRFEAEVSLKGTVASLASDGRVFTLVDMEKNLVRTGPACPSNVASLVRIPLAPHEVAAVLLGDVALGPRARPAGVSWDPKMGAEVLDVAQFEGDQAPRLQLRLQRSAAGFRIVGVDGHDKRGTWRVRYEDFRSAGGVEHPARIKFAEPGRDFDDGVEIDVRDRRTNPPLPEGAFVIAPPEGFQIEQVGCGPA